MAATTMSAPTNGINGAHSASGKEKVVNANLNFYLDPSQGGKDSFAIGTAGAYRRKFDSRPVQLHDARGYESEFSIDTHGFQYYKRPSTEKDFTDDGQVKGVAYPEAVQLIKDVTGATNVYVFSHITRRNDPAEAKKSAKTDGLDDSTPVPGIYPASYIHIDQTPACALQVLQDSFDTSSSPGRHALQEGGRWGIINLWRPISKIKRDPLAVCDARTIDDENLLPIKILQPPKTAATQYATTTKGEYMEIYSARFSEGQQWYFVSGMDVDETLLIKCFDSTTKEGVARRCPHSAFDWRDSAESAGAARESIEIRCLVFWEDQKS